MTIASENHPEMQLPLIHLNGNDGKTLGLQYWNAFKALQKLEEAFEAIDFHSRDYYPLGDEAWLKARAQRTAQWANITSIRNYLEAHSGHCFESAR